MIRCSACYLSTLIFLSAIAPTAQADYPNTTQAQRAVADFYSAVWRKDSQQFNRATFAGPGESELVQAGFAINVTLATLRDELVKRFGPSAVDQAKEGFDGYSIALKVPPVDSGWTKELEFTALDRGKAAKAFNPYTGRDIVVVKDGEIWKVDPFYEQRGKLDLKEVAATLQEMNEAVDAGLVICRKEGATLKDVVLAVNKKLFPGLDRELRGEENAK